MILIYPAGGEGVHIIIIIIIIIISWHELTRELMEAHAPLPQDLAKDALIQFPSVTVWVSEP
jgi:hypothetical protein